LFGNLKRGIGAPCGISGKPPAGTEMNVQHAVNGFVFCVAVSHLDFGEGGALPEQAHHK